MSFLLTNHNAAFIHIPKTGGQWVKSVLEKCELGKRIDNFGGTSRDHSSPHDLPGIPVFFAFVRHPVSWYESWWKFQAGHWRSHDAERWHPQRPLNACCSDSFERFISRCLVHEPAYVTRLYEWYFGPPEQSWIQFFGRYENLREDLKSVLRLIGVEVNERIVSIIDTHPAVNASQSLRGNPRWTKRLIVNVRKSEIATIRRFYPDKLKECYQ